MSGRNRQRPRLRVETKYTAVPDAEALAYVSNASLSQPIASEWVHIYQYLMTRVMGEKVPEDMRKESLGDYQMGLLSRLKEWIYRQRVKDRKEKRRVERARARAEAEAKAPKQMKLAL